MGRRTLSGACATIANTLFLVFCLAVHAGAELALIDDAQISPDPISHNSHRAEPRLLSRHDLKARAAAPAQPYSHGDPTDEEQFMLEIVNRARANPNAEAARLGIDLNEGLDPETISAVPKQPLAFNVQLIQAAREHSQWMLDNDTFAHVQTGGIDPSERMEAAGYVFSGSYSYGENLAFEATTGPPLPVGPTVAIEHDKLFIDEGIEHRGHRVSLMGDSFREIGIGVGLGLFTSQGRDFNTVMVTQDFGSSDANPGPFLVGVAYRDANNDGFYTPGEGLENITVTPSGGKFFAVTSASGGYAVPLTGLSGTIQVVFSSSVRAPVSKSVTLTGQNGKVDFEANRDVAVTFGFSNARRSINGEFEADLYGPANTQLSLEASEDLIQWTKIGDILLTGAVLPFTDAQAGDRAHFFYRLVKR